MVTIKEYILFHIHDLPFLINFCINDLPHLLRLIQKQAMHTQWQGKNTLESDFLEF